MLECETGVGERDPPVALSSRCGSSPDRVAAVPEAEDEVPVAVVRVVLHHVPQDRAVADRDQRLRERVRGVADARARDRRRTARPSSPSAPGSPQQPVGDDEQPRRARGIDGEVEVRRARRCRAGSCRPSDRFSTHSIAISARPALGAADRAVEPALAELRLALRVGVDDSAVVLQDVEDLEVALQRVGERGAARRSRGRRPRCGTRGSGRAACASGSRPAGRSPASSTAARRSRTARSRGPRTSAPRVAQHVLDGAVDLGAAPAPLVVERARVADAGDHQPVADARRARPRCGPAR